MVTCIILYDHVHAKGSFSKNSDVNVKNHIKLIQTYGGDHTESLLNALRYTTKHLNDESTPKAVKQLLG
jgi:thiaminase